MSEKLCVFCEHWAFQGGDSGYSELTPGWNASMECNKGYWKKGKKFITILHIGSAEEFRKLITQAETCPDYKQVTV